MKLRLLLLFLLPINLLLAQKKQESPVKNRVGFKLSLSSYVDGEDFVSGIDSNITNFYKNKNRHIKLIPSLIIQNKKKNFWEFSASLGSYNYDNHYKKIDSLTFVNTGEGITFVNASTTYSFGSKKNKQFSIGIGAINHINLLKKKEKLRLLLSLNYYVGYEYLEGNPYGNWSFYQEAKTARIEFGLSTRIGYNFTKNFFVEIQPPIIANATFRFGKLFTDNPLLPLYNRRVSAYMLDTSFPNKLFGDKYSPFTNSTFSQFKLSIGYIF